MDELHWLSAVDAVRLLREGGLDLAEYVEALIDRTARLTRLNTYVTHDPDRIRRAVADGPRGGPLYGLPFALKDVYDTADLPTSAATPALRGWRPRRDAPLARRLLDAGGTLMGKQTLGELSLDITGNNPAYGPIGNPYNAGHIPGGSSGGTAAGVAAGLVPFGLGGDTGGSLRIPAALCGCVGFRPTHGRYDGRGMVPISSTRDTAGPIARSVADVRLVDAICAPSGADPDLTVDLAGLRLGVPSVFFYEDLDPDVATVTEQALGKLASQGAVLVEQDVPDLARLNEAVSFALVLYEVGRELSAYLYQHAAPVALRGLAEEAATDHVRDLLASVLDEDQVTAADHREALTVHRPALRAAYARYFAEHEVDALLIPTTPLPARAHRPPGADRTVELNGRDVDTFLTYIRNTDPASNAGLPCLSVPSGLSGDGLPIGLELVGPDASDARLLAVAEAVEQALPPLPRPDLERT
ncbi:MULTISPECIES: amidase family protein [Actinomadura]|uniref:Amidase n=1 Tax=Actinomadura litoris TaxID=2678616 RepID=A0A7K1L2W6_9ACTN|nr:MULTISPECIES: amidase family protein [Actinomadura]MBT2208825.1 indole acetimide hydrolase [Actinomadura sp. NEAU-AAG7]MUN38615.1 amidase [Actinomadura litoris]